MMSPKSIYILVGLSSWLVVKLLHGMRFGGYMWSAHSSDVIVFLNTLWWSIEDMLHICRPVETLSFFCKPTEIMCTGFQRIFTNIWCHH